MTLEVSEHRRNELIKLIDKWNQKTRFCIKELQSLIGKLSFVTNCVRPGRIFISQLLEVLREMPERGYMHMKEKILQDLNWWRHYLPEFNGISILWLQDCLMVDNWFASDASMIGGGAMHGKQFFHFKFPKKILEIISNIAQRELLTIMVAIKLWSKALAGKVVRFSTDNQVSMHAINSGRTRDGFTLNCIKEIAWVCAKNEILLKASYIESRNNEIPDVLSRWYQSAEARCRFKRATDNMWVRRLVNAELLMFQNVW